MYITQCYSRISDVGTIVLGASLFKILRLLAVLLLVVHTFACVWWKVHTRRHAR